MVEEIEEARRLLTHYCERIDTGGWYIFATGKRAQIQRIDHYWTIALRHAGPDAYNSTHKPICAIHEALGFLLHHDIWRSKGDVYSEFVITRGYHVGAQTRCVWLEWNIGIEAATRISLTANTAPELVQLCDELVSGDEAAAFALRDWIKLHVEGVW